MNYQYPREIWITGAAAFVTSHGNPAPTAYSFSYEIVNHGFSAAGFYVSGDTVPPGDLGVLFHDYHIVINGTDWIPSANPFYDWQTSNTGKYFYVYPENTSQATQNYIVYNNITCGSFFGAKPALQAQAQAQPAPPYFYLYTSPAYQNSYSVNGFLYSTETISPDIGVLEFN